MERDSSSNDHLIDVLIVNPSPDVYGSDLQMLQSVRALHLHGARVTVALPGDGPLVAMLRDAGAEIDYMRFPVLRRADNSSLAFLRMIVAAITAIPNSASIFDERSRTCYTSTRSPCRGGC